MRVALVANEGSGSGRAAGIADLLDADVVHLPFQDVCDGKVQAIDADRVVAAGGDGTLGPAAQVALRAAVPLAVVPVGTANSFARWLGLPLDLEEAARLATRPDATTTTVEVAHADGRPFVNVAATGLSVLAAHRARPLKRRLGPLAYAVGAARAAATGRPLHTTVACDGRDVWEGDAWQVLVSATGAFGGESSTGGVDPADQELDVAIVESGPRLALLRRAYGMRRGKLVEQEQVRHVRGASVSLCIDGEESGVSFHVDGEVLDLDRLVFEVLGGFELVVG